MKRRLALLLFLFLSSFSLLTNAQEIIDLQPLEHSIKGQLEALELNELLDFSHLLDLEYREFLPSLNWRELLTGGRGESVPNGFLVLIVRNLLKEFFLNLHFIRQLIAVGILAALLQRLSTSFGAKAVVDLSFAACFLMLILIGLQSFQIAVTAALASIDQMVSFMHSLLPVLSTLLVAVGGVTSSTVFHPLLWGIVGGIASIVQYVLFPMILFSTAFSLTAHFSADLPFTKLGEFFRQGVITILGILFLVFSGFMVVRGAIAPVSDGITLRAAKYFTKTLIPIAGGMFADTLEVIVGGSLLIKNGVGIFGLMMIVLLVTVPLLKVWAMVLIYKLVAALLEPLSDNRLVKVLNSLESALTLIFISLGTVAVMFLLSITILVGIGNLTVFMR